MYLFMICETNEFIGKFGTVECSRYLRMGKDTLTKYIDSGKPFKG